MAGASLWAIFMRQNATRLRSSDCRKNKKKIHISVHACMRANTNDAAANQRDIFLGTRKLKLCAVYMYIYKNKTDSSRDLSGRNKVMESYKIITRKICFTKRSRPNSITPYGNFSIQFLIFFEEIVCKDPFFSIRRKYGNSLQISKFA